MNRSKTPDDMKRHNTVYVRYQVSEEDPNMSYADLTSEDTKAESVTIIPMKDKDSN
jgi:hypothetical protein